MLRGAGEIMDACKKKIGPKDHLSADGAVHLAGGRMPRRNCVNAPMAQINDYYYEDLTA